MSHNLTYPWEQRKLNEIVSLFGGNAFKSTDSEEKGIRWLKIANVGFGKIDWTTSSYLPIEYWEKFSNYQLFKNDYVMALTRPILNSKLKIAQVDTKCLLNQRVAKLKFFVRSEYGYQLLNKKDTITLMENELAGTDPPNLGSKNLENIEVYIINSEVEQSKIGNFFKQLDETITLQERELGLLKEQKKGFLQKMFPKQNEKVPELRFKDFTDDWEQRKLGEVADIVGGGTPSTSVSEYWDGDIDWYAPAEIGDTIFVNNSKRKITKLGLDKSSARVLPIGTVLFTSRAGIGNTAILSKEGATNQGFQSIIPKVNQPESYFIYSKTSELKRYGEITGAGSTFVEVSGKQMAKMSVAIPKINEQAKIGNFFKQLDETITLQEQQLKKMKEMKKGFLQKMFV